MIVKVIPDLEECDYCTSSVGVAQVVHAEPGRPIARLVKLHRNCTEWLCEDCFLRLEPDGYIQFKASAL